jgi:hypothetical protein
MLHPNRSSQKRFECVFGQEWALHRSYWSLDATLQVVCNLFGIQGPDGVLAWFTFKVNILFNDSDGEGKAKQESV